MAKFSSFCAQVQIYILVTVFSILYHLHNVYTNRSMKFIENNKLNILISLIMNVTVSVIWGVVINLFLTLLGTTLMLGKEGLEYVGRKL